MPLELLIVSAQTAVKRQIEQVLSVRSGLPTRVDWVNVQSLPAVKQHMSSSHPDVVLLDLTLPGCEEAGAVTAVCQQAGPGKVVALTPAGRPETGIQAMQSGAALYLDSASINADSLTQALKFVLPSLDRRELTWAGFRNGRFQQLFESAPSAFLIVDRIGQIVLCNQRAERLFGYTRDELIGLNVDSLIPSSLAPRHRQYLKAYFEAPVPREMGIGLDMFALRKDQTMVPVEIGLSPIETPDGLMVLTAMIDITVRKAAQTEIRERVRQQTAVVEIGQLALEGGDLSTFMQAAAEMVATTLDVTHTAVWQLDTEQNGLLLQAGKGWPQSVVGRATIFYSPTTAIGQALQANRSLVWTNINEETRFSLTELLADQGLVSGLVTVIGSREQPYGVLAAYATHPHPFSENDAKFLEVVSNVLGTAATRYRIEAERKQSQRHLAYIIEASTLLNETLDYSETLATVVEMVVPEMADWCAVDILEADGLERAAVAHADPALKDAIQEIMDLYQPVPDEPNGIMAVIREQSPRISTEIEDKKLAEVARSEDHFALLRRVGFRSAMIVPLLLRGHVLGAMTFVYASSERIYSENDLKLAQELAGRVATAVENARLYKKSQESADRLEEQVDMRTKQLQEVNEELEAFAYSVSHDLRAPLRAMDGFSRILLEDYAADIPREAAFYMERIRHNAQQMAELINDLLQFSRLSREPLQKTTVKPTLLVRQVLQDLRAVEGDGRQIDVTLEQLPPCAADVRLLRQVWANLLENALKYTRNQDVAHIHIGSDKENGEVVYFVRDNGAGFNMAYADKLFGVFQRLHRAEEYEGTGVGLATVQRIIHRHNGRIWAESVESEGSTFFFTLGIEKKEREKTSSG